MISYIGYYLSKLSTGLLRLLLEHTPCWQQLESITVNTQMANAANTSVLVLAC